MKAAADKLVDMRIERQLCAHVIVPVLHFRILLLGSNVNQEYCIS